MTAEDAQWKSPFRAAPSAPGRAQRLAVTVASVLLVGIVVAGCGSDPVTTEGGPGSSSDAATTTEPLGPELTSEWTGVRTDGSGLTIALLGLPPVTDPADPCQADYRAAVDETDQEVTVTVHGTHVDSCTTSDIAVGRILSVELDRPLGDRLLTNGATQRREIAFDGDLVPDATWLPDRWELLVDRPADPATGTVTTWQIGWGPSRSSGTACGADVSPLTLTVGPAQALLAQPWVTSFTTVGTTTVRGTPAEQARYQAGPPERPSNETMIRWSDGDEAYVLRSAPSCVGEEPADFTLLQRLADGLY
jgi:hypothetical protein